MWFLLLFTLFAKSVLPIYYKYLYEIWIWKFRQISCTLFLNLSIKNMNKTKTTFSSLSRWIESFSLFHCHFFADLHMFGQRLWNEGAITDPAGHQRLRTYRFWGYWDYGLCGNWRWRRGPRAARRRCAWNRPEWVMSLSLLWWFGWRRAWRLGRFLLVSFAWKR